ncbi:MAG: hypothetical protein HKP60_12040 [Eudoraea sp.]|nr:hypothetical protein [Eudoraea sp.]NNJ41591.1 hypothetical protein [Eudoraea sp.]
MNIKNKTWDTIFWVIAILFLLLGILNAIYIHHIPAIFYMLISLFYVPPLARLAKEKLGFGIPRIIKLLFALFILWATLAIGELMELFESYLGH